LSPGSYRLSTPRIDFHKLLEEGLYSAIILSRHEVARTYLPLIRKYAPGVPVVFDTVDVHFVREARKAALFSANEMIKVADETRADELSVCGESDVVITVTEDDAAALRERIDPGKKIVVIPNIHPVPERAGSFSERKGLLFVGNFSHPPNPDAISYFCGDILPAILEKLPDVRLYVVGGNSMPMLASLASDHVVMTGYVPDVSPFLDVCRVSVAPLRYGAGMKGKIGEAMAHGLPVVTTAIGAEGMKLLDGQTALLAENASEFAHAVVRLYTDEMLWERLSLQGQDMIRKSLSPHAVKPLLDSLFQHVAAPALP
jgi:glycosyltransferase involved in cell wall biosynthesis